MYVCMRACMYESIEPWPEQLKIVVTSTPANAKKRRQRAPERMQISAR